MRSLFIGLAAALVMMPSVAEECIEVPAKLSAVSAVNAFLDEDGIESPTYNKDGYVTKGKAWSGNYVHAYPDESKGYFQNWTVKPATLTLEEFALVQSDLEFEMPTEAVSVTANMIAPSKLGAWVYFYCAATDEEAWAKTEESAAWSPDKGKTWIPDGLEYPMAPGTYTIKFRAPKGWVAPADLTLVVNKPTAYTKEWKDDSGKTVKETYYDPERIYRQMFFYPETEEILTTVKFDGNGGKAEIAQETFPSAFVAANGLPLPSVQPRSGYAFNGWWTAKEGGQQVFNCGDFDPMWLDPESPTLYAHWLKTYTVTLGGADMYANAWDEEERFEDAWAEGKGAKMTVVGNGQFVYVEAPDCIVDKSGKELVFQKWTVTPSTAVLGGEFYVQSSCTTFLMPEANITLTPTYVDEEKCGWIYASAWSDEIYFGSYWDEEAQDYFDDCLRAEYHEMQWSPDGGKTWYNSDDEAMLPAGKYTVQWRSTSPMWQAPAEKRTVQVVAEGCEDIYGFYFTFVPVFTVDALTPDGEAAVGCTVTMNPKDGRLLSGKTITFTAKEAKTYAFQGWKYVHPGEESTWGGFEKTMKLSSTAVGKVSNSSVCGPTSFASSYYVDPVDYKVHIVAQFKSISDYTQDDLDGSISCEGIFCPKFEADGDHAFAASVYGMTGCDLYYCLDAGFDCYPITYKLASGKLPKGLKFDAKTGEITGVPTAKDGEKATCVFTITDPAKNVVNIKLNFDVRPLQDGFAGEYRGMLSRTEGEWVDDYTYNSYEVGWGLLEMSISSAGKVSAKLLHQGGTASMTGTLSWNPNQEDVESIGEIGLDLYDKNGNYLCGYFLEDGTLSFEWSVSYKDGTEFKWFAGWENQLAYRQDLGLYAKSAFVEKYFTLAFGARATDCSYEEDVDCSDGQEAGYLTIKTDKKGVAKVSGKLPDGTAVSANALVLPECLDDEPTMDNIVARLFVFNAPSSYKKNGYLALPLLMTPYEGKVGLGIGYEYKMPSPNYVTPPLVAFTAAAYDDEYLWYLTQPMNKTIFSVIGAEYSAAKTLENYYWQIAASRDDRVNQQMSYKEGGETCYYDVWANDFSEMFFDVTLAGDNKGSIGLERKSPAPWEQKESYKGDDGKTYTDSWWNYEEDKKGNPITDPSQLSFSFTKATGIFSGKANVYFDYWDEAKKKSQHKAVSVPFSGVMIHAEMPEGSEWLGVGSAVYSVSKVYDYWDYMVDKKKTVKFTEKIPLWVGVSQNVEIVE